MFGNRCTFREMTIPHSLRVAMQFKLFSRRFMIGLLHDAIEDGWISYSSLARLDRKLAFSVNLLSRKSDETYAAYIDRIIAFGSSDEIDVKRADLLDNYRRCMPSLRVRYARALMKIDGRAFPAMLIPRGSTAPDTQKTGNP